MASDIKPMDTKAKDIKLVALDLDGTLLNSKHKLSDRNKTAVKKAIEDGVQVVIATGKTRASAVGLLEELGIKSPGVFIQGLAIYNGDGSVRNNVVMDKNILRRIITFAEDRGFGVIAYSGDRLLVRRADEFAEEIAKYGEPMAEGVGALQNILDTTEINKLILYGQESKIPALRWQLSKQLDGQIHLTRSAVKGIIEVLPANSSKGKAVMRVMKDLNIPPKNTMAIGDGENDIEMLQAVGTSVAMGNAIQKLKDVASQVVGSNDEDGVAQAIEMFVTGKIEEEKPSDEPKADAKETKSEKVDIKDAKSEAKTDTKKTEEKSE
jgi:Cof subfamily protein (haloacid dehalogenase superfamily)